MNSGFPRLAREGALLGALAAALFAASPALAHGVVGQRLFLEPMVTMDANPANELDLLVPSYHPGAGAGPTYTQGLSIEKTILPMTSLGLSTGYANVASAATLSNPDLSLKQALWRSEEHEGIFSVALGVSAPLATSLGGDSVWGFAPAVILGKGLGDLPDSLAFLRPLAIQADVDGDFSSTTAWNYNVVVSYSLPYLMQHVQDVGLPSPLDRMLPMVEFTVSQPAGQPLGSATAYAKPGIMWIGRYTELGVAGMLPLNPTTGSGVGIAAILDVFLDDVFPALSEPTFGGAS